MLRSQHAACLLTHSNFNVFFHADIDAALYHLIHTFFPFLLHWLYQLWYIPLWFPR